MAAGLVVLAALRAAADDAVADPREQAADATVATALAIVTVEVLLGTPPQPDAPIVVALFDSAAAFDARRPCRSARLQPGTVSWRVEDLEPGTYAALAYQDLDNDGELGLDERGLPVEPYAVSRLSRARAPRFERASVQLDPGTSTMSLNSWHDLRRRTKAAP